MNRRGFLRGALGVVVAAPALVEALSTRSIFLPPRGGWLARDMNYVLGGVPSFLTNYIDPQIADVLLRPGMLLSGPGIPPNTRILCRLEGELDADFRKRMYKTMRDDAAMRKATTFFQTETKWRA